MSGKKNTFFPQIFFPCLRKNSFCFFFCFCVFFFFFVFVFLFAGRKKTGGPKVEIFGKNPPSNFGNGLEKFYPPNRLFSPFKLTKFFWPENPKKSGPGLGFGWGGKTVPPPPRRGNKEGGLWAPGKPVVGFKKPPTEKSPPPPPPPPPPRFCCSTPPPPPPFLGKRAHCGGAV